MRGATGPPAPPAPSGFSRVYQDHRQLYPRLAMDKPVRVRLAAPALPELDAAPARAAGTPPPGAGLALLLPPPVPAARPPPTPPATPPIPGRAAPHAQQPAPAPAPAPVRAAPRVPAPPSFASLCQPVPGRFALPASYVRGAPADPLGALLAGVQIDARGVIDLDAELQRFDARCVDYDADAADAEFLARLHDVYKVDLPPHDFEYVMSLLSHCAALISLAVSIARFADVHGEKGDAPRGTESAEASADAGADAGAKAEADAETDAVAVKRELEAAGPAAGAAGGAGTGVPEIAAAGASLADLADLAGLSSQAGPGGLVGLAGLAAAAAAAAAAENAASAAAAAAAAATKHETGAAAAVAAPTRIESSPAPSAPPALVALEAPICEVCGSDATQESNQLVLCAACGVGVHEDCYGLLGVPAGRWLCKTCRAPRAGARCVLCGWTHGAFKRFKSGEDVHLVCALWMPGVDVPENAPTLEPVTGLGYVDSERRLLRCCVCRNGRGACIQCAVANCCVAFHPYCARLAGYATTPVGDVGQALQNQHELAAYCLRHSRLRRAPRLLDTGAARRRIGARNGTRMPRHAAWRSARGTLYFPRAAVDALARRLRGLGLTRDCLNEICRYWVVRMDARRAMFGRRRAYALEVAEQRLLRAAVRARALLRLAFRVQKKQDRLKS